MAVLACAACTVALLLLWPHARTAAVLIAVQDDPAALSDARLRLASRPESQDIEREIADALAKDDADLARSFIELAQSLDVPISSPSRSRVEAALAEQQGGRYLATRFATGLVTGDVSDGASLAGTLAGDLVVFGDIRDVIREGKHVLTGEDADHLVLGLACVGLAVTAGTYASIGAAAPVRAGLTVIKDARRAGRLSKGLGEWAGRSIGGLIDRPLLAATLRNASLTRPASAIDGIKAAVKLDQAGAMITLAKDVGRVGEKAGARAAVDVLKVAEHPADIGRAARLAAASGGKTRAIIKILGRSALLLTAGAFNLASWMFAAILTLFGFVTSIKATTERLALRFFRHRRETRQRARERLALAMAAA